MSEETSLQPTEPADALLDTPAVVHDTETRVAGRWTHGPRLTVHLDHGEPCELAEKAPSYPWPYRPCPRSAAPCR